MRRRSYCQVLVARETSTKQRCTWYGHLAARCGGVGGVSVSKRKFKMAADSPGNKDDYDDKKEGASVQ